MAVLIPELLSKESENYIVSIRLMPDGLSFSGYNPRIKGSFFIHEEKWNSHDSYLKQVEDFFFAHDFLSCTFKRFYVVQAHSDYTLVPLSLFLEKKADELYAFTFGSAAERQVLYQSLKDDNQVLLYSMMSEVYTFCTRSLVNPIFVHTQSAVFTFWKQRSLAKTFQVMFLSLSSDRLTIACYRQGQLLFTNYFQVTAYKEILYYTLYIWKQQQFDVQKDQLYLSGEAQQSKELKMALTAYIQHVDMLDYPSEVYLMGTEILRTPIDLIALSLCEL